MTMDGGATGGYWAIGNCVIATPPITMMNKAITHAKMGRSIKNLAMLECPLWLRCRSGRCSRCGGLCRRRPRSLPRDGFYGRAGRQHLQLLETVHHDLFPGLQPLKNHPPVVLCGADLDGALGHLAVFAHHAHGVALLGARDSLLRQCDGIAGLGLLNAHAQVQAGQQLALGGGDLGAQRDLARGVASPCPTSAPSVTRARPMRPEMGEVTLA